MRSFMDDLVITEKTRLNTHGSGTHGPGGRSALVMSFFPCFSLWPNCRRIYFGLFEKMIDEPVNTAPFNEADVDSTYSQ